MKRALAACLLVGEACFRYNRDSIDSHILLLQIQDSDDWENMTSLQSLTLSDISNLSPKSSFLAVARLPTLQHVSLKGSMPADTLSFKTLMQLSHTLGARGIPVDA